jgi:hypothetical protein
MIAEERIVKKKTSKMRQGVSARLETASTSRTRARCCAGSAVPLQISPEQSPRPVMKREAPTQKAGTGFSDDARDYLLKRFDKINNAQRFHAFFTSRPCFYESRRERTASSPLSSSTDAPEGAQCSKPASGHSSPSTPGALTTPLCASGKMLRVSCGAQRLPRHDLKTSLQYRIYLLSTLPPFPT